MSKIRMGVISCSLIATIIMATGCGHEHVWSEATCTEPKTCTECGETEGTPLEHSWTEATCTSPKTCSRCGETEGTTLEHDWEDATCTAPKTCKVCGETEGDAIPHEWVEATFDAPKTCSICGLTEGGILVFEKLDLSINGKSITGLADEKFASIYYNNLHKLCVSIYDINGNETKVIKTPASGEDYCLEAYYKNIGGMIGIWCDAVSVSDKEAYSVTKCYDPDGNEISMPKGFMDMSYREVLDSPGVYEAYTDSGKLVGALDSNTRKWTDAAEYGDSHINSAIDMNKYTIYGACSDLGYYFVERVSDKKSGYVDEAGNEIAMFDYATKFDKTGHALISSGKNTYSIIDKDMNVVCDSVVEGKSKAVTLRGDIYCLTGLNGKEQFYKIVESDEAPEVSDVSAEQSEAETNNSTINTTSSESTNLESLQSEDVLNVGDRIEYSGQISILYYMKTDENSYSLAGMVNEMSWENPEYVIGSNVTLYGDFKEDDVQKVKKWKISEISREEGGINGGEIQYRHQLLLFETE